VAHKQVLTTVPAARSALWFQELYAGWRSANFLHYSTHASDTVQILSAEALELRTAATGAQTMDGSMSARAIAVWVIVEEQQAAMPSGVGGRVLNAMAHWSTGASALARVMRLGVATKDAAATILKQATSEGAEHPGAVLPCWLLVVRWATAEGATHSAIQSLGEAPRTSNSVIDRVQRTLCNVLTSYDRVVPTAALAATVPVPLDAFATQSASVDAQFVVRLEATPVCVRSQSAATVGAAPLENTGVFVRVCEKKRGEAGISDPSAFHGVLLSFGSKLSQAATFANSADPSLTCPLGLEEEAMGLHLCAVQTEACALAENVSLFSHVGRAGEPIHPPGSHVYRECAAIRPVEPDLLAHWDLRPCDKSSTLPKNPIYHAAYQQHFARASHLYLSLSSSNPEALWPSQTLVSHSSDRALHLLSEQPSRAHSYTDCARTDRDDAQLQLLMHVDLSSRRTTVAEAYTYLLKSAIPAALRDTMLLTISKLGVRASLSDMFDLARASLKQQSQSVNANAFDEASRLKRLSDVCLSALATEDFNGAISAKRPRPEPLCVSNRERVRRMLGTLGLRRGAGAVVGEGMDDSAVDKATSLVQLALKHVMEPNLTMPLDAHAIATKAFAPCLATSETITGEAWLNIAEAAVARVVVVAVVHNLIRGINVFLITDTCRAGATTIQKIAIDPLLNESSFDDIIATPREKACVLILQHVVGDDRKCKLTATVPIVAATQASA
jgi:hypothetical protein